MFKWDGMGKVLRTDLAHRECLAKVSSGYRPFCPSWCLLAAREQKSPCSHCSTLEPSLLPLPTGQGQGHHQPPPTVPELVSSSPEDFLDHPQVPRASLGPQSPLCGLWEGHILQTHAGDPQNAPLPSRRPDTVIPSNSCAAFAPAELGGLRAWGPLPSPSSQSLVERLML